MTAPRTLIIATACCLALGACDFLIARKGDGQETEAQTPPAGTADTGDALGPDAPAIARVEPEDEDKQVAVASTGNIDWEAARRDMASTPSDSREATGFQVESQGTAPPVPVLLPTGIVTAQGAGSGPRFQPTSDGYFAAYPGLDYDIVVNGTNEVIRTPGDQEVVTETDLTYTPTMTGAQVSFSRYGADYLVEFECKSIEDGEADCITEEEALEVTQKLVIAGTR